MDRHRSDADRLTRYDVPVPTCPRCKVAFLDGESHVCERKRRRGVIVWSFAAVAYGALWYASGSPFAPGAVVIYLFTVLMIAVGHVIATVLRVFGG